MSDINNLDVSPRYIVHLDSEGFISPRLTARITDKGIDRDQDVVIYDTNEFKNKREKREMREPLNVLLGVMNQFNYHLRSQDNDPIRVKFSDRSELYFPGAFGVMEQFAVAYNRGARNG